ncbi:hypothetical protein BHE74_00022069 [Ensete ventricosum]|nr:hypothetical protein BHE74_00022069 [Ensete ventricosum]
MMAGGLQIESIAKKAEIYSGRTSTAPYSSLFPLLCSQITCSRLCQSRRFHGTLRVKRLPDFEDRPCGSKSMPCSIEALVCDFSSLVTVPAMLVLKNKLKYN